MIPAYIEKGLNRLERGSERASNVMGVVLNLLDRIDQFQYQETGRNDLEGKGNHRRVQLISYQVSSRAGVEERTREILADGDGSYVLALTPSDEAILLLQLRPGLKNPYQIELPAGSISAGEDPKVNAIHELAEEAGANAVEWSFLGAGPVLSGRSPMQTHFYLAEGIEFDPRKQKLDEDEFIFPFTVPLNDILLFCRFLMQNSNNPELKGLGIDPKILAAVALAQLHFAE